MVGSLRLAVRLVVELVGILAVGVVEVWVLVACHLVAVGL